MKLPEIAICTLPYELQLSGACLGYSLSEWLLNPSAVTASEPRPRKKVQL